MLLDLITAKLETLCPPAVSCFLKKKGKKYIFVISTQKQKWKSFYTGSGIASTALKIETSALWRLNYMEFKDSSF